MIDSIPENWVTIVKNVASPAAVIAACSVVYFLFKRSLNLLQSRGALAPKVVSLLRVLLRWVFILLVIFLLLSAFGVLKNVWAAFLAVIAMVAVGFVAVWSVLSNIFCTLLLLIYRPFQVGDRIKISADDLEGEVTDLNLMYTTLSGQDEEVIYVPNNLFFQKAIRRIPGNKQKDLYEQLKTTNRSDG
ncbi:MAG: mechanosensitive ion channel [Myxococcota bacterium]|nr:mechanosensitive ion channel [Myxococcota bacterium]